jgi:hydrogenase maturation protease
MTEVKRDGMNEIPSQPLRICILGLGNLMRTDDAVGMLTVRMLEADPGLPADVKVIEGGTLGLDLLGRLDDVTHMIVIDAVDFGAAPGTKLRCDGDDVARLPTSKSVHLLGLSDLINVMRLMDLPEMQIVLFGVQPDNTEWGTELTPPVAAVQNELVEATLQQIAQWTQTTAKQHEAAGQSTQAGRLVIQL